MLLVLAVAQIVQGQYVKRTMSKGPRALGLLELAPGGKAHLIPITILFDGKFYDAGAYKAAPVPMALEPQTVYEAVRSGVSQGLFTITDVRQLKTAWIADGSWLPAGSAPPKTGHNAEAKPIMGDIDAPPTLRRGAEKPSTESSSAETKPPATQPTSAPAQAPAPSSDSSSSPPATRPPENPPAPPQERDKDAPVLHRGKPTAKRRQPDEGAPPLLTPTKKTAPVAGKPAGAAPGVAAAQPAVQLIPAISDAGGPDPRPYAYETKPDEEQKYRQKILALAAEEIRTRAKQLGAATSESSSGATSSARQRTAASAKARQPSFDDVQLRFFDLSSSNEPILVLTATARMPRAAGFAPANTEELQYFITLVAHADIYGELRKLFSNVTDTRHLDAIPRMELIDAVDVDGDGRGELLFREISDAGSAFNVYRVTGDQLWPLFEGTPQ